LLNGHDPSNFNRSKGTKALVAGYGGNINIGRISWIEQRAARIAKSEWSRLSPSPAAPFCNASVVTTPR
jgi:hypothetical protein